MAHHIRYSRYLEISHLNYRYPEWVVIFCRKGWLEWSWYARSWQWRDEKQLVWSTFCDVGNLKSSIDIRLWCWKPLKIVASAALELINYRSKSGFIRGSSIKIKQKSFELRDILSLGRTPIQLKLLNCFFKLIGKKIKYVDKFTENIIQEVQALWC